MEKPERMKVANGHGTPTGGKNPNSQTSQQHSCTTDGKPPNTQKTPRTHPLVLLISFITAVNQQHINQAIITNCPQTLHGTPHTCLTITPPTTNQLTFGTAAQ
ncbi:TPA: hypothetical protein ACH3X1_007148 [Trebouxia sp. C0004]